LRLAKEADPSGERTLAVLSKADLLEKGTEDTGREIIENRKYPVQLGWAAVICRNKQQRRDGLSIEQGIEQERKAFQQLEPWCSLSRESSFRLGIPNLRIRIAELLESRISAELGTVQKEVKTLWEETRAELDALGPELPSVQAQGEHLKKKLAELVAIVRAAAKGHYEVDSHFFRDQATRWCALIANTMEGFAEEIPRLAWEKVEQFDEFEWDGSARTPTDAWRERDDRIRASMRGFRGRELPGFLSSSVFQSMFVDEVFQFWDQVLQTRLAQVRHHSDKFLAAAVDHVCGKGANPRLLEFILGVCVEEGNSQWAALMEKLDDEKAKERMPATFNDYFYENVRKMRLANLRHVAHTHAHDRDRGKWVPQDTILQFINEASNLSNSDQTLKEMKIFLSAFTKVSRKRFVDAVLQSVFTFYVDAIPENFQKRLNKSLDDHVVARIYAEPESKAKHREALKKKLQSLTQASKLIQDYCAG
jgi:hypothetical protein